MRIYIFVYAPRLSQMPKYMYMHVYDKLIENFSAYRLSTCTHIHVHTIYTYMLDLPFFSSSATTLAMYCAIHMCFHVDVHLYIPTGKCTCIYMYNVYTCTCTTNIRNIHVHTRNIIHTHYHGLLTCAYTFASEDKSPIESLLLYGPVFLMLAAPFR